jgi:hypothetical protein
MLGSVHRGPMASGKPLMDEWSKSDKHWLDAGGQSASSQLKSLTWLSPFFSQPNLLSNLSCNFSPANRGCGRMPVPILRAVSRKACRTSAPPLTAY